MEVTNFLSCEKPKYIIIDADDLIGFDDDDLQDICDDLAEETNLKILYTKSIYPEKRILKIQDDRDTEISELDDFQEKYINKIRGIIVLISEEKDLWSINKFVKIMTKYNREKFSNLWIRRINIYQLKNGDQILYYRICP